MPSGTFWDYMQNFAQHVDISSLRNKRIAVDGHVWLCELARNTAGSYASNVKKPYLAMFYNRCRALIENGIDPIVVFDNTEEPNCGYKRKCKRPGAKSYALDFLTNLPAQISEIKNLLDVMGVRWMASKFEGEAQCAQLEKRGLVHGCITRDFDYILFGGDHLYEMKFSVGGNIICDQILVITMDNIADKLCVSRSCLIAMAIMMGCDYYDGIPGVGVVTALEIISEFYIMKHDHPETILDRFRSFCMGELKSRNSDSLLKLKLRRSCEKLTINIQHFNLNSDLICNMINLYVNPMVFDYSRMQLPKKVQRDVQRTNELLIRECNWDPNNPADLLEKPSKQRNKERNSVSRGRSSAASSSKHSTHVFSKRELAAVEKIQSSAKLYRYSPKIEVISVPSTSEDVLIALANTTPDKSIENTAPNGLIPVSSGIGLKRENANENFVQPSLKRFRKQISPDESQQPTVNDSPVAELQNSEAVVLCETPSDRITDELVTIEDIQAANALRVIPSTA